MITYLSMLENFGKEQELKLLWLSWIKMPKSSPYSDLWVWESWFNWWSLGSVHSGQREAQVTSCVGPLGSIQCTLVASTAECIVKISVWCDCKSMSHKCQRKSSQLGRACCEVNIPLGGGVRGLLRSFWPLWATSLCYWNFYKLELLTKSGSFHLEVLLGDVDPHCPDTATRYLLKSGISLLLSSYWKWTPDSWRPCDSLALFPLGEGGSMWAQD